MSFIASFLFLAIIILHDEYKIYREKKRVAPESQKRIRQFNSYMKKVEELRKKDYSHSSK